MKTRETKRRTTQLPSFEHGKVPPNSSELEELVLGAIMLDNSCLNDLIDILRPDSFYRPEHECIYAAILKLFSENKPVDIATVSNQCKKDGTLDLAGGAFYISKLTDRIASGGNAEFHARIIEEKAIKRELIRVAGEAYNNAYEDTSDPLELLDTIARDIEGVSGRLAHSDCGTMTDQIKEVKRRAKEASAKKGVTGRETGIKELDLHYGGRQNGHFIIIAARPAMGKTAAALCEALNMAYQGVKVLFVSLEMSAVELTQRALSVETGIELSKFRTGDLDPEQWRLIEIAEIKIANSGLTIVDDLHTVNAIRAHARRMRDREGLDAIYIDYIQLIQGTGNSFNREGEVSAISRSLKLTARTMNVPVIGLAQLSRGVETRGGTKRPMLSDLRESGSLEQDADIVEFLYRPEYYGLDAMEDGMSTAGLAYRLISKNRHGGLKDIPMRFHHVTTKFTDWEVEPAIISPISGNPYAPLKPNRDFDNETPPF